jgi:DNA-directed RNA polymerase specialized sigma24 family protein
MDEHRLREQLQLAAAGQEEAIAEVWLYFYPILKRAVIRRIATMPKLAGEASDVTAFALQGFLGQLNRSLDQDLADLNRVWAMLKICTLRHINDLSKNRRAQKRGGNQVTLSLDSSPSMLKDRGATLPSPNSGEARFPANSLAHGVADWRFDDPSQSVLADELLERLLSVLDQSRSQQIVLLRLDNRSTAEIADILKVGIRTIQRELNEIERLWSELCEEPPDPHQNPKRSAREQEDGE